jgi:hypothetical protein
MYFNVLTADGNESFFQAAIALPQRKVSAHWLAGRFSLPDISNTVDLFLRQYHAGGLDTVKPKVTTAQLFE